MMESLETIPRRNESAERLLRNIREYSKWIGQEKKSRQEDPDVLYPGKRLEPDEMKHPLKVLALRVLFPKDNDNSNQDIVSKKIKSLFCLYGTIKEPIPRYRPLQNSCDYVIEFDSEEELKEAMRASKNKRIRIGSSYITLYRMIVKRNAVFSAD